MSRRGHVHRGGTAALLVFVFLFPVLGSEDQQEAFHRLGYAAASLRQEDLDAPPDPAIIDFTIGYGRAAGSVTSIEIDIAICFSCGGIVPTQSIWVRLPGFSRQNILSLSTAMFAAPISVQGSHANLFSTAIWNEETRELRFICSEKVLNGNKIKLIVPFSAGITLPAQGIRADPHLYYYTDSSNGGPHLPELVEPSKFRPIGYFSETAIDFAPTLL